MAHPRSRAPSLARALLDAQVAYHLERWSGDQLAGTVTALADDILAAGGRHQIEDLVDREAVKLIAARALATMPASAAARGILELVTAVVVEGPAEPYPLGELVDRGQVATLLDSVLALHPVLERLVEASAEVPLVGTTAARFMGRIVGEVAQANKTVADKVPGLGSLVSFGTRSASRVMGAADRQFEALFGDTMGKGGAFAVRRLNRVVIDTVLDPTTRLAVLQTWDLLAREQVVGLSHHATQGQISDVADALHDVVITVLATDQAADLAEVVIDGLFDGFGGYTPTELLDQLDLRREDVVHDLVKLAVPIVDALRESGDLEQLLRAQLEPFFTSAEVTRLLG
ncbi:hypothetical protein GCM10023168_05820 [Fodinibacter luteus]|uniref:DUF2336 domain-containing protein n=1 Tax=Fodinibacter luteus TaxID=552064 RepID=A0ABP8K0Z4_9MICO